MGIFTFEAKKIHLFLLAFFCGITGVVAQCPTVVNPSQTFCDLQSPTVGGLVATNNGGGVVWYADATGGTPLSAGTGLVSGEDYFADSTAGCGSRQQVTVTIYSAPIGLNFQGVCVGVAGDAVIGDLQAIGNNVKWYTSPSGGSPLPVTAQLADNTIYYASQTNPDTGCETSRLSVFVNVGVVPTPTGPAVQQFCSNPGGPAPTIADLVASGVNNWYPTSTSAVQLPASTPLANGQSYFATTVDPPCESQSRLEVVVQLLAPNNSGTAGNRGICENLVASTAPFNLFQLLGGAPANTGTWTGPIPTSNGAAGTVNPATMTLSGSPYVFTYTVDNGVCATTSSTVTITILPSPVASISGNATICSGGNATVTFTGTPNATVTYNTGGPNQTIVLNASGTATITGAFSSTTTFNLVSVASSGTPSCSQTLSGSVTVSVLPLPTATIGSDASICSGSNATITFTGTPGATVTFNVGGANLSIVLNGSGTASISGTFLSTTTFTLVSITSAGTPSCSQPLSGSATITVIPPPTATITGSATICMNGSATVNFSGTPNATVTYTQSGIPGDQTIVLNGSGTASITGNFAATTTFTLVSVATSGTPVCSKPISGSVTITVLTPPTAAISSDVTVCSGGSATINFSGTANATVTFNAGGANQTIVLDGSGTASISSTFLSTTTFTLVSVASAGTPSCTQPLTGSVTVTVAPLPVVAISSNATICSGDNVTTTFTGTPNASVVYHVGNNPNQTIVLNASGIASITAAYTSTTTITLVSVSSTGTPACNQPQTGSVTITVVPPPTATISSSVTICSGGNATITFTGTPNATITYNTGGANQTIVLNATGTATISGTFSVTTTFTLVSIATAGTPACTQPLTGSVTITAVPLPTASISSSATVCAGGSATITFTGTPDATVTYNTGGANQTIVLDGSGTAAITGVFTATTTFNLVSVASPGTPSCSQPVSGSVTITVLPVPVVSISSDATICPGESATVTFTGTPNATVIYNTGGADLTIALNGSGNASITGVYTTSTTFNLVSITAPGVQSCTAPASGTVTITVVPPPTVMIGSDASVCTNGSATITFSGTPNAAVIYTVSGIPGSQTIVLDGSGTATVTGNYTATTTYTLVSVTGSGTPACVQPVSGTTVITVLPPPTVTVTGNISICSGESATITFTGTPNAVVTYNTGGANQTITLDGSGIATISGTFLSSTTFTLVSVSTAGAPGCSQPQTGSATITVLPPPMASVSSDVSVCSGNSATVTFTGTPGATVTYTTGGANQTIVLDATGTAMLTGVYLATTTFTLIGVATSGTPSCTAPASGTMTINVIALPVVAVSASATAICSGTQTTITFTGTPNAVVTYNDGTANQTIVLDQSGTAVISPTLAASTTYSLVSITTAGTPACSKPQTGSVAISVTPPPAAGNDVANLSLCSTGAAVDLFSLLGATAQPGGTWSPALASGTGVFDPAVDASGSYTYTVTGTAPCENDTATVTISILPPPNAGNDATLNICSNADALDLFALLGATAQPGGTWSPALASGTDMFDPGVDAAATYIYTVAGTAPCADDTAAVAVTITPGPDAGENGSMTVCADSDSQDLFDFLGGTPQPGGSWSPALASGTGVFDPGVDAAGIYTYTFFGNQPCDNDTATVTVTVNPIPDAGTDGSAFFCSNYPAADLFTSLGGTPQPGGSWSPALASGTGVFDPLVDAAGVYTYNVGGNLCSLDQATVSVSVVQSPNAGGAGQTLLLNECTTATSVDLFSALNGSQGVGTWTDDDASGALSANIFNPSQVTPGSYHFTYTVSGGVSPCTSDAATVTVIVAPIPDAGTFGGVQTVCTSAGTFDLATLLGGEQPGGVWTDGALAAVANPLDIALLSAGTYSYTYTIVNACGTDAETVQLTILPVPALTIPNITLMTPICLGGNATINLSGMTDGNYTITYDLSGSNTATGLSAIVTITGGAATFTILPANLSGTGTTTITFTNIANTVTSCSSALTGVQVNIVIRPTSDLDSVNLSAANTCQGNSVTVAITGATGLSDGNYQFNYNIPGAAPETGTTGITAISSGAGQFALPGTLFPTAGNYTMTISGIVSLSSGCDNLSETAAASFQILASPDVSGATVSAANACLTFSNEVTITGANGLTDGTYTVDYELSGANTATGSVAVTFTGGDGSFTIPAAELVNAGEVTLTVTQLASAGNVCTAGSTAFNTVNFTVSQPGTPELIAQGNEFCATDNPTIATLSANIQGSEPVTWYDSATGGTAYAPTDALVNGATYYATLTASGCESPTRLAVTVDLSVCDDIIIPDGFSPNNDGINDEFVVVHLAEVYPNYHIEIYNRYGNILYKGGIDTPNWDGTASQGGVKVGDGACPVGVYFFIIEFNDGAREPLQGRVYLSR